MTIAFRKDCPAAAPAWLGFVVNPSDSKIALSPKKLQG